MNPARRAQPTWFVHRSQLIAFVAESWGNPVESNDLNRGSKPHESSYSSLLQ
jgi:hypothetical protein